MRNQGIAGSNQATEESHPAGAEAASVLVVDMSEGDQWVLAQTLAAELNFSEHIPVTAQQVLSFLRRTPGLTQENSRERFMQYYTNSWCCIL
ncbi:MAG: hypothetical protein ACR2PX_28450 [Endozoicomonas sp.]|uniref:hypothetical protein n=1 Tax=Endozoicomonas sp. TaxID=1892382 RepID=UPI003D9B762A